jgi:transcription elongation factor SPT5
MDLNRMVDLDNIAEVEEDFNQSKARYRKIDMKRQEVEEEDAEQIAERLEQRYGRQDFRGFRGDLEHVPQSLLIPSVNDPKLWLVRCKVYSTKSAWIGKSYCSEYLSKVYQS